MQGLDLLGEARAQLTFAETDHEGNVARTIRGPEWKLIQANLGNPRGLPPLSLFHVAEDPGETRDMSQVEAAKLAQLSAYLDQEMALAQAQALAGAQAALDEKTAEQLRNIGY
jgi:arylsulfatase A-like enzyme